jgi:hypothetical protein
MKKKENEFVCCICGRKTQGYGNNPWPIKDHGKCCNECNEKVIKARIEMFITTSNDSILTIVAF